MESDSLTLAKLTADPTISLVGENETIPDSEPTFGAVNFYTLKLGVIIKMSMELAQDAPNIQDVIEDSLGKALALKLDTLALNGGTSGKPSGIVGTAGVGTTGSVGGIAWEDLHTAVDALETLNEHPNAAVGHPTFFNDLSILTSGDGINSAKLWLPAPPTVSPLMRLGSTQMTTASGNMILGDFRHLMFAFRTGALIVSSTEAGTAYSADQVWIKLTQRFDIGVTRPSAFHILQGVTT